MPKCTHFGGALFAFRVPFHPLCEHPRAEDSLKTSYWFFFNLPWQKVSSNSVYLLRAHLADCSEVFADSADFSVTKTQASLQCQVITESYAPNLKHPQPKIPMAQLEIPTWYFSSKELAEHTEIIFTYCNHAVVQQLSTDGCHQAQKQF